MPKYAKVCWTQYLEHRSASRLVDCVYQHALHYADTQGEQKLVPRATEALVNLARSKGQEQYIELNEIAAEAGIVTTAGTKGLYPWLKGYGADVLEQRTGARAYIIKKTFYNAMLQLFPAEGGPACKRSIIDLQGLGKGIWAGIDAQQYVNHERASWAG